MLLNSAFQKRLLLIYFSLLGFALSFYLIAQYQVGISPDSVGYLSVAKNFAEQGEFVRYDGQILTLQPPLYPVLLGIFHYITGTDLLYLAGFLNSVLFAIIIALSGLISHKLFEHPILIIGTLLYTLMSVPLLQISRMIWSEPLFIVLSLLFLLCLNEFESSKRIKWLFLTAICVSLASLTRYAGVTFLGITLLAIFLSQPNKNSFKYVFTFFLFVIITMIPFIVWIVRNFLITGTFFGPRYGSMFGLSDNLFFTLQTITSWYFTQKFMVLGYILICAVILINFGFVIVTITNRNFQGFFINKLNKFYQLIVIFCIVYLVFIIVSSTTTAFDKIDNRLLSPLYVPVTLLILSILYVFSMPLLMKQKRLGLVVVSVGLFGGLIIPYYKIQNNIKNLALSNKYEYNNPFWENSETINYLKLNDLSSCNRIISNAPDLYYLYKNQRAVMSPLKTSLHSNEPIDTFSELRNSWPSIDRACLIWFNQIRRDYIYSLPELKTVANLEPIVILNDGAIFKVTNNLNKP